MKRRLRNILLALPGFAALCRLLTRRHVRAIMYHRFSARPGEHAGRVDRESLYRQCACLVSHHALWTPDDHLAALTSDGRRDGHCPVVITVDDGYHDFYDIAYPVFREHGILAMLFTTTGVVDGTTWFWWDKLEFLLQRAKPCHLTVTAGGKEIAIDLTTAEGRHDAWHNIADRCRFLPNQEKEHAITSLATSLQVELPKQPVDEYRAVTWEQIRSMSKTGILIGAHTVNHPILSCVSREEAKQEIEESGRRLAEQIGRPVHWFCYPQGGPADFTPEVQDLVKQAGYRGSYLAYQALDGPDDIYAMPRYCASADMVTFRWTLCGAEYLVLRVRKLLGLSTDLGAGYWAGSE